MACPGRGRRALDQPTPRGQLLHRSTLPSTASSLTYVLYIHHSSSRKTSGTAFLAFGGYQPIYNRSPTNPKYSENLSLCLTPQTQHYSVQWLDPKNGAVLSSQTIAGMSACGTPISSPNYAYDIVLKVSQVP